MMVVVFCLMDAQIVQQLIMILQHYVMMVLVKPLYVEWHKLLGETVQPGIDCLEQSLKIWETEGSGPCVGWESEEFVR